jgi:GxxExxY protein
LNSDHLNPLPRPSVATEKEPQNVLKGAEFLYQDESYVIRGAIFEVYKEMGCGFLEAVYQECLRKEFIRQNIPFREQVGLQLTYKGETLEQTYAPDFICYGKIIVEIKGVKAIAPEHRAQLINYLKATGLELGFLVNFGAHPKVEIERMVRSR